MDVQRFQTVAPVAAAALALIAVLTVLGAFRLFRKSRRDSTWRFRREAGQRGWRMLLLGFFMLFMAGVICASNFAIGYVLKRSTSATQAVVMEIPSETPTTSPSPEPMLTETATETPTVFVPSPAPLATDPPTETETHTATPTTTRTLTLTPSTTWTHDAARVSPTVLPSPTQTTTEPATLDPRRPTALQSSVTPPAGARIEITALDNQISGAFGPINAATTFAPGFNRIYFFVTYSGMGSGMIWRGNLLQNGGVINRFERLWGTATTGSGYFFFSNENGFGVGDYEIRLYFGISQTPAASATFRVAGSAAASRP